jgi:methyl coenzyme M reductase beta subunit
MDELLNGTNPDADTRLMLAVQEAMLPDAFDGGCPADVTADPVHGGKGGTMGDAAAAGTERGWRDNIIDRSHTIGRVMGIYDCIDWMRENGYPANAQALSLNCDSIEAFIRERAAKGG